MTWSSACSSRTSCSAWTSVSIVTMPAYSPRRPVTAADALACTSSASRASCNVEVSDTFSPTGLPTSSSEPAVASCSGETHRSGRSRGSRIRPHGASCSASSRRSSATDPFRYAVGHWLSSMSRTRASVSCLSDASAPMNPATMSLAGLARIASGVSYCITCDWLPSTAIRSPSLTASLKSWVTKTMVLPRSDCSRINSSCSSPRVMGSTAPNGSSISSTGGSAASARATPTRCCCPPDNCRG